MAMVTPAVGKPMSIFLSLSTAIQDFKCWGKSHIFINLSVSEKNVWITQYGKNSRTTLNLLFYFVISLENNFPNQHIAILFFSHGYVLVCRMHPTDCSEENTSVSHIDKMLD